MPARLNCNGSNYNIVCLKKQRKKVNSVLQNGFTGNIINNVLFREHGEERSVIKLAITAKKSEKSS